MSGRFWYTWDGLVRGEHPDHNRQRLWPDLEEVGLQTLVDREGELFVRGREPGLDARLVAAGIDPVPIL